MELNTQAVILVYLIVLYHSLLDSELFEVTDFCNVCMLVELNARVVTYLKCALSSLIINGDKTISVIIAM